MPGHRNACTARHASALLGKGDEEALLGEIATQGLLSFVIYELILLVMPIVSNREWRLYWLSEYGRRIDRPPDSY